MPLLAAPTGVIDVILAFLPLCVIRETRCFLLQPITTERGHCAWLKAISREHLVGDKLKNTYVCEKHFVKSMLGF